MLLTRSLPPQFLLPAWGTRPLYKALQRAYSSDERNRPKWPSPPPSPQTNSLFDQLFPEERSEEDDERGSKSRLPAFEWDEPGFVFREPAIRKEQMEHKHRLGPLRQLLQDQGKPSHEDQWDRHTETSHVLILNCASKTLEESDFFRVSPRGDHIEGWTRGILKVIQDRDANSLEPLGVYFIFFSSESAAQAYLDQTIHLHRLAEANSVGLRAATLPPPPGLFPRGEDSQEAAKTFSLVPSQSTLCMRFARQPLNPLFQEMLRNGGLASMAKFQHLGEGKVLLSVDKGQIRLFELRAAIQQDGKNRNLHWALAEDENGVEGIWALANNQPDEPVEGYRAPPRYVLSFKDRYEARRFVREWHRRPFPIVMATGEGDERKPMVNAQIMW